MRYALTVLAAAAVVKASPFPQAVTAAISPTGASPPGCTGSRPDSFGIAVMNVTTGSTGPAKRQVSQIDDGQPQAPTAPAVCQITDGQPQPPTGAMVSQVLDDQPQTPTYTMPPVSTILNGQAQGGIHNMTMMPISQIADGQPQAPTIATMAPVTAISDGQTQAPDFTAAPVTQIADGQTQADTTVPVSQIADGQPQASTAGPVSQIEDGQPQASTTAPVSQAADAQPEESSTPDSAPGGSNSTGTTLVACRSESTLELTLNDGILKDGQGRTGYIASNYQFQFDAPPQAGAIYTSGFSICGNGSLALGGSNIFYQCLSGSFYNLYDRNWAAQCSPITIEALTIQDCD